MEHTVEREINGRLMKISTGKLAKQADGAVVVSYGDTMVLVTAVANRKPAEGIDFFPLTVEYREKLYAIGKIPGGFIKREGKPKDNEILSARLIDRPLRPLFPEGFFNETQIIATVLSSDQENDADILGIIGASAALMISPIPFNGPVGAVRIGLIGDEYIVNPTFEQLEESRLNLVIAGTKDAVTTIEAGAKEISEDEMYRAIEIAHEEIKKTIELQEELMSKVDIPEKLPVNPIEIPSDIKEEIISFIENPIKEAHGIKKKKERNSTISKIVEETLNHFEEKYPDKENIKQIVNKVIDEYRKELMEKMILEEGKRIDGRGPKDIRPITCEVGILPRTHGSALFTRGETQSLGTVTLGTRMDEQKIEDLEGESFKRFMLHYNFPPFSTGEVKFLRGPGRREIGHGFLAEKALEPLIPDNDDFPYTIRVVSDILESNGSSSMATVCSGSLSLMDAGIPIKSAAAGIAMGLIYHSEDKYVILSDILGDEDHLGHMDFKVAGTRNGITALQLDTKIQGIPLRILKEGFMQAKEGRMHILDIMEQTIKEPRPELSPYAPKLISLDIPKEKIGLVIGPGGKMIRSIIEKSGAEVFIEDDGKVLITATNIEDAEKAKKLIESIIEEPEEGKVYMGKVTRITDFGAFVEILPGKEGLVHISELEYGRVNRVEDILHVGDEVMVKLINIDNQGRISLSRKATLPKPEGWVEPPKKERHAHNDRHHNKKGRHPHRNNRRDK